MSVTAGNDENSAKSTVITTHENRESFLDKNFSVIVGLLLAVVTIIGAVVGWRSAVAGSEAGGADNAGIIAALAAQEANTISGITSSQHESNYLNYWLNKRLLDQIATDGTLDNITDDQLAAVVRELTETADLATASKLFFPAQYLNADGTYNATREQAESVAEVAQERNLNAQAQFDQANAARDKSMALLAALIVLGISLTLLASAEAVEHRVKYVLLLGGILYLLIGTAAAVAIEAGSSLSSVYDISSLLSYIVVALVVVGIVGALITGRGSAESIVSAEEGETPRDVRLKAFTILLIAVVALSGAVLAYLQGDTGNRADSAIRRSQLQAAEALGVQTTGEAQVNFQYGGAAAAWEQLKVRAAAAAEVDDARAEARFLQLQDDLTKLSPLLRAPYFTEATDGIDLAGYQADQYVAKAATLSASSAQGGALDQQWGDKSDTYVIHLTLLAAALALLGLSLTFSGIIRPLFLTVGGGLTLVTLIWASIIYFSPVNEVPQAAIDAYGRGVGLDYRSDTKGAIAAFDESLKLAPGYGTALYARGDSYMSDGNYEAAITDFKAAQGAGKDDANVAWDLGYASYLLGRFDDAVNSYNKALQIDPSRVWVRLDLAIAYLAQGKNDQAVAEYTRGKSEIADQVAKAKAAGAEPPPSTFYYLDAGADDLESLIYSLDEAQQAAKPGAPPKSAITDVAAVQKIADEQFYALKSMAVALEYTGKPPTGTVEADFAPFEFGIQNEDGTFATSETFPSETKDIAIIYSYEGMRDGQQVLWKVYVNGDEYPEYRTAGAWDKGASGDNSQSLTDDFAYGNSYSFDPGDYVVELYVENQLVQRGFFTVEQAAP